MGSYCSWYLSPLMDGETEDSDRTGLSLFHKADSARPWGPVSSSCSVPAGAPFGVPTVVC